MSQQAVCAALGVRGDEHRSLTIVMDITSEALLFVGGGKGVLMRPKKRSIQFLAIGGVTFRCEPDDSGPLELTGETGGWTMRPEPVSVLCRQGAVKRIAARGPLMFCDGGASGSVQSAPALVAPIEREAP